MVGHLSGNSQFYDAINKVVLRGEITLMTDGSGRSEIVVSDMESGRVERLVFTALATWIPVYQLIQAIQDIHQSETVEVLSMGDEVCPMCEGRGFYEDDEGNWPDCTICVR